MASNENIYTTLEAGFRDRMDEVFLSATDGKKLSYAAVAGRASRFAGTLVESGIRPGDRVMTTASKSADAVALYLAALLAGATYVPLNPGFTPGEVDYYVADAEPSLLIADSGGIPRTDVTVLTLDGNGGGSFVEASSTADPLTVPVSRSGSAPAAMLYTSGTTGSPKGAILTHDNLRNNGLALRSSWGFRSADVLLHALPLFHTHGLFVALHCALMSGCEVIFLPRFDTDQVVSSLSRATVFMGVPTYYSRLLADPRLTPGLCAGMRLFTSGSAPLTEKVHADFESRTGHKILERYGMTEAGIITSNPLEGDRLAGTVGYPLPGVDLRVRGPEGLVAPSQTGVVEIRGPSLFAGYWRRPEKTRDEHDEDGWFSTGDIGRLDASGRLTLEGRANDMIISGGENIYPKEIELCLDSTPGVVESAVVGAPSEDFGEIAVAFIVAEAGLNLGEVQSHLSANLARFKHPRRFEIVTELPRNAMGKVQKSRLRSALTTDGPDD